MGVRLVTAPWEHQPQEIVQLNSDWVARGLQSVWLPGVIILPGGARPASGGIASNGVYGAGSQFNGTNQGIALGLNALSHGRGNRIAWMRIGSASGSRNISAGGNAGTGFRVNGTTVEIVNTGASVDLAATSAVSAGETCALGMSAEPFNLRLYKNGVLLTSRIDRGTGNASNNLDTLGQTGTGSQYLDGAVFMHVSFSGRLSDEDHLDLYLNPWQLFEERGTWVPSMSASTGVTLTVADADIIQVSDSLTLTSQSTLTIADALFNQTSDSLTLEIAGSLIISDAFFGQTVDSLVLTTTTTVSLIIDDALIIQQSDNVTLTTGSGGGGTTMPAFVYWDWLRAASAYN